MSEAIRIRLARLDPAVVELLRVAALVGLSWTSGLLARVAQLGDELVEERLLAPSARRSSVPRPTALTPTPSIDAVGDG